MRWRALFDDLEAQAEQAGAAQLAAEVADRTRSELATVRLADRFRASVGRPLVLSVEAAGQVAGRLSDVGADWALLEAQGGREIVLPLGAVMTVVGLTRASDPVAGQVGRRLDLRYALRGVARSRSEVTVVLRDGTSVTGTVDRVLADHFELAEHPAGEARRPASVHGVRIIPLSALALLRAG